MANNSRIEWTHSSWNPVTGCDKISAGCEHCYAERMAKRLQAMGVAKYANGFRVTLHKDVLNQPLSWSKPKLVFVNSMSDMFHDDVPLEFIKEVFDVMVRAEKHQFQVLTKRSKRMVRVARELPWPNNVWLGVTVENKHSLFRIKDLLKTAAATKWISFEPLIGPLGAVDISGIHWAVVGGESGPGARPMKEEWVKDIRRQCREQKVPFFFKQWGGVNKKATGRVLDGRLYSAMPSSAPPQLTLDV